MGHTAMWKPSIYLPFISDLLTDPVWAGQSVSHVVQQRIEWREVLHGEQHVIQARRGNVKLKLCEAKDCLALWKALDEQLMGSNIYLGLAVFFPSVPCLSVDQEFDHYPNQERWLHERSLLNEHIYIRRHLQAGATVTLTEEQWHRLNNLYHRYSVPTYKKG